MTLLDQYNIFLDFVVKTKKYHISILDICKKLKNFKVHSQKSSKNNKIAKWILKNMQFFRKYFIKHSCILL